MSKLLRILAVVLTAFCLAFATPVVVTLVVGVPAAFANHDEEEEEEEEEEEDAENDVVSGGSITNITQPRDPGTLPAVPRTPRLPGDLAAVPQSTVQQPAEPQQAVVTPSGATVAPTGRPHRLPVTGVPADVFAMLGLASLAGGRAIVMAVRRRGA